MTPRNRLRTRTGIGALLLLVVSPPLNGTQEPASDRLSDAPPRSVTYAVTDDNFPNPERGFYRQHMPFGLGTQRAPLDARALESLRREGLSLVRAYYVLDEFREAPISREALRAIDADMAAVRFAGLKIILRFAYNFPAGGAGAVTDVPVARALEHIDQLAPGLRANGDVLAFMEMGFVGAFGEWHSSTNVLVNHDRTLNTSSSAIVDRVLFALPEDRMAALRYPFHKQQLFGLDPLGAGQAFQPSAQARIGAHNDCFASDADNGGTYSPTAASSPKMASLKKYLSVDNQYLPQGGETCGTDVGPDVLSLPYSHCPAAVQELRLLRWSTINIEYKPEVLHLWTQEGCLDEIKIRLGYRLQLVEAEVPEVVSAGAPGTVRLRLANIGWATPYNPRLVELVLRGVGSGQVSRIPVAVDPRFWAPGATHSLVIPLPATGLPPGLHDVLLHLPDPAPTLYGRPEYSIRLANPGVWEPATGFNDLGATVTVR